MPSIEDLLKNDTTKGVALGLGAALVGVAAIPLVMAAGKPFARVALKSGLLFLEKSREALAEASEGLEDLVAEVKAELASEQGELVAAAEEVVAETTARAVDA